MSEVRASIPPRSALASHWRLCPDTVYLNHGSFGACPTSVLEAQTRYRDRIEADAVRFFVHDIWSLMDQSRDALAGVLGCKTRDLVLVPNATWAVATVLGNIDLKPGDELLTNAHEYPACKTMFAEAARRAGARVVEAELPWPVPDEDALVEALVSKVTDRTRLCLLSGVTSPTAIIMPADRIVRELRERGVETLLDAAHTPGYSPIDIDACGAAYTTANCHKWLCAPKGSAFLHVREDLQETFRPLALSIHGHHREFAAEQTGRTAFNAEFDYVGTDDYSARLAIADAIGFMTGVVPGGLEEVERRNRELCLRGRDLLCERLGVEPAVPDDLTGAMAAVNLPDRCTKEESHRLDRTWIDPLKGRLIERWGIQVPLWCVPNTLPGVGRVLRVSAQLYNTIEEFEYLADALLEELAAELPAGR